MGGRGQNRKETANEACFNNRIDGVQEKMLCTSMISIPRQTLEGVGERKGGRGGGTNKEEELRQSESWRDRDVRE